MIIQVFPSGPFETRAYAVTCPATKRTAFIDPAPESAAALMNYVKNNQLIPDKILLTHSHWDHMADAAKLKKAYQIPVYVHAFDAPNLKKPGSDGLPLWIAIESVEPDHLVQDGEKISLGELTFEVIETPGHTPGGVCFYCKEEDVLFSGDTLFKGTIGNLSFPTARPHLMWSSLEKLAKLPSQTRVFPGHGPETKIGSEKWLERAEEIFGDT